MKAHRVVLAAVSEPLDRMIFGPTGVCGREKNVLTLTTGIAPAALRSVVEYAYSGTLEFTQGTDGVGRARGVHVPRARPRHETVHSVPLQAAHACECTRGRQGGGCLALHGAGGGSTGVCKH